MYMTGKAANDFHDANDLYDLYPCPALLDLLSLHKEP